MGYILSFIFIHMITTSANADQMKPVHNYIFFGRDRERINDADFLKTAAFEGAQVSYSWKELEHGEDGYDFSDIQDDLKFLTAHGKKLFIQLTDVTFDPHRINVPQYLLKNPKYHGGVGVQYDNDGKNPQGWVARRWDPAVRERFQKLFVALAKSFDGKIEGINLEETAVEISEGKASTPSGFTYLKYRDGIKANMKALRESFQKTTPMQFANFMPGDSDQTLLRSIYDYGEEIGVAMGSPDLMPKNPNQLKNPYKMMHEMKDVVPVGIAVQDGNYIGKTGDTSVPATWPNIVPDLDQFAREYLRVSYIFWGAQVPFFAHDVVPYFEKKAF